jgi:single-strand DNA-binding protein
MSNVFTSMVRVGRDPELKAVGQADLVTFSGAVTCGFGDKKTTMWIVCNMWGKLGTSRMPYIKKGNQIMVSGELSTREYDAKDGSKKTSIELNVNNVEFVGKKEEGGEQRSAYAPSPAPATRAPAQRPEPQARPETDDDMPF